MEKNKFNIFDFFRSTIHFLKIVVLFFILLFILYWIQNLTGSAWTWFKSLSSVFDFLVEASSRLSTKSIMLFEAVFEFKYFIVVLFFLAIYAFLHLCYHFMNFLDDLCYQTARNIRKIEENKFNESLKRQNIAEQKKIKRYQIYVETFVKPKYAHREFNINLEEQNQILLKHLVEKTGVCPDKYEKGFIFTFDDFSKIDNNLDIFSKLFESKAPIDYLVCVQIIGTDSKKEISQINTLISLKFINKITSLADTAYRYDFNNICRYKTSQLGNFQKGEGSFELFHFVSKD